MGLRLHFILICASSLLETSTHGYRIPPPPPPPYLDLDILHNTANHFQDVGTVPYGMYNNNLQPSTQKILHTLLQEIAKLDMLSKERKSYNWRKLVSILKYSYMKCISCTLVNIFHIHSYYHALYETPKLYRLKTKLFKEFKYFSLEM